MKLFKAGDRVIIVKPRMYQNEVGIIEECPINFYFVTLKDKRTYPFFADELKLDLQYIRNKNIDNLLNTNP